MMSAYFTKLLPLLQLTSYLYLIDRADAKFGIHGVGGGSIRIGLGDVPPSLFCSRRTTKRKKAVAVGTPPQRHHDTITIISNLRGGGSGSGIEENPEYDDDRSGTNADADAAGEDFTIRNDNDVDSSDETEGNENSDSGEGDSPSLLSKPKFNPKRGHSTSRIRSRHTTTAKHPKSKSNTHHSINKHFMKLAQRHQVHCYIVLAIIAFRSDIFELACRYHLIPTVVDPVTSLRKIKINWSTDVLKLMLVIEVVRRYFLPSHEQHESTSQSIANEDRDESGGDVGTNHNNSTQSLDQKQAPTPLLSKRQRNPPLPLLLILLLSTFLLLPRNISYFVLPMCLRILLTSSGGMPPDPDSPMGNLLMLLFGRGDYYSDLAKRMAYLPPLEQHYTFEQLNERYFRDWGAYRKAFDTHSMVTAAAGAPPTNSGGTAASLVSLITTSTRKSSLLTPPTSGKDITPSSPTTTYPSKYNNGTVIVLDMTKLDTQASKMESVRDQINFITHYLAYTEENSSSSHDDQRHGEDIATSETNATAPNASFSDDDNRMHNATQSISTASTREPAIEVIVLLESPGGGVSQYGLAASHLQRLRSNPNVKLTICIDSVAASGGYMMACMSSPGQLYCAPFAMVGSIGVIGQSLNVQKTLEGYGVRPYVFRGGKMKNPVGMIGDVTKEGVVAMQLMVDRIHDAFRDHVSAARKEAFAEALKNGAIPKQTGKYFQLGTSDDADDESNREHIMDHVATGDVFIGVEAIKYGLVDRLITSDEYISERIRHGARVLKLMNYHRPMGLWGFFGAPSPQHRMSSPSVVGSGLIDMFKNMVHRSVSVRGGRMMDNQL